MDVEQLPDILFTLVGVEAFLGGEPFSNLGEFELYAFGL